MTTQAGSVALSVGKIEAGSSSDVIDPPAPLVAADVGVRWAPVPGRGDRRRGALVSAVQLSYRDIEELLVERGVEVDHFTVYRGAQRFTPLLADTARLARHSPGHRWHHVEQYANNPIEGDHSGLKHQPKPMRGLRTDRTAYVVIAGHASR